MDAYVTATALRKTRQKHPGMPDMFRKTLAELSRQIAFFFARLEIKRRQDDAKRDRAAHFAERQRRSREGQQYTGVNRMANRAIRPGVNQLMVRANADRSAPVRAQMPPGPNRQTDPRNRHNRTNDSEKLVGRNESRSKHPIMYILGEHEGVRGGHRKHVSHTLLPRFLSFRFLALQRGNQPIQQKNDPAIAVNAKPKIKIAFHRCPGMYSRGRLYSGRHSNALRAKRSSPRSAKLVLAATK